MMIVEIDDGHGKEGKEEKTGKGVFMSGLGMSIQSPPVTGLLADPLLPSPSRVLYFVRSCQI